MPSRGGVWRARLAAVTVAQPGKPNSFVVTWLGIRLGEASQPHPFGMIGHGTGRVGTAVGPARSARTDRYQRYPHAAAAMKVPLQALAPEESVQLDPAQHAPVAWVMQMSSSQTPR